MANTFTRAHLALTTDALPHANNLAYTVPALTKTISFAGSIANTHATNSVDVDVAVDIGGAGTTFRYILKTVTVPANATILLPKIEMEAGDKLRARASANSNAEAYFSLVEMT